MTIEDDIAFLSQVPVLRRLGAPALRILAIGAEAYSVEAGQVLFAAGDAADCAYVVQQGSFQITPERAGDADLVAEPGSLLGEGALLVQSQRPAHGDRARGFRRAAHLARDVSAHAGQLSGGRAAPARADRVARRPMGARDGERPHHARPQYRAALLAFQFLLCRRCSISRLTSRASKVAG